MTLRLSHSYKNIIKYFTVGKYKVYHAFLFEKHTPSNINAFRRVIIESWWTSQ